MSNRAIAARTPGRPGKAAIAGLGMLLPGSVLILWQTLGHYGMISEMLFPTPYTIAQSFISLASTGDLWSNLRISVIRALSGFLLGGGLGLLFGVLVGLFRRSEKLLDPSLQMIRMIPSLAVVPLFILWFGIGEESKVLLIAKGAFFRYTSIRLWASAGLTTSCLKCPGCLASAGCSRFSGWCCRRRSRT